MHIKSIKLKNFKKFSQDDGYEVKFPSDLTVVRAPNETGKSTIVSAITAGFFLSPKSAKSKVFQSWQSDKLPQVSIIFEDAGETLELFKDFEAKDALLSNLDTGEKISNIEQINKKIGEIFGFFDESIFTGIFSVDQDAFHALDNHKITLRESLENLVTGSGSRTVSEIIASLEKDASAITKQSLKNPGHLQRIKGEISKIDDILAGFDTKFLRFNHLSLDFENQKEQLDKIEGDYNAKKQTVQFSKEIAGYKKDLDRVDDDLEKLEFANQQISMIDERLNGFEEFKNIDVDKLKNKIVELTAKVDFKKWSEESNLSIFIRSYYKILIYTLVGLSVIFGSLSFINIYFSIGILLAGVFTVIIVYFHNKISKTYSLRLAAKDLSSILKKFNANSKEELYKRISDVTRLFSDRDKLKHSFAILGGESAFLKYKDERKRLLRVLDATQIRVQELDVEIAEDDQLLKRLSREVDVLERNRAELKESLAKIQGELKGLSFSEDDKIRMDEMRVDLTEQLEYWEKKLKILESTTDLMVEAREKTLLSIKDRLGDYISGFLSIISGGKYKKIFIDQDFSFKVFSDERGDNIVPEDNLSRGAIDQFYLTIRFAFARILSRNKRGFMVLDDPFHNFDEERKNNTRKLLQDLTSEFQVILFTHSDEYDKWGEVVEI